MTESDFMQEHVLVKDECFETFVSLKEAGIRLAIDDFGVEYSSLRRLVDYPFDTIKIDKSFVQGLLTDKKKSLVAIIKAVTKLAEDLGYDLVAEGVETQEQENILRELGCVHAQGFYYHKPMDKASLLTLLKQQS